MEREKERERLVRLRTCFSAPNPIQRRLSSVCHECEFKFLAIFPLCVTNATPLCVTNVTPLCVTNVTPLCVTKRTASLLCVSRM